MRKLSSPAARVAPVVVALFAVALQLDCASSPTTASTTPLATASGAAQPSSATPATSTSSTPPAPASPLDALRARGTFAREPLHVAGSRRYPARVVAFVANGGATVSAWTMSESGADLAPAPRWPVGVTVTDAFAGNDGAPYALVQSLAVLDQPAGLHGVVSIDAHDDYDDFGRDDDLIAFQNATTVAAAKAIVDAPPPDTKPMIAAMKSASGSLAALKKGVAKEGLDLYEAWQGTFLTSVEHLDAAALGSSPREGALRKLLEIAAAQGGCGRSVCQAVDDATGMALGHVVLAPEGDHWMVRGFFLAPDHDAPKPAAAGTPRLVASTKGSPSSEDVLRRQRTTKATILGEAPLSAGTSGGTLAITLTDGAGPEMVIHQGVLEAVLPLNDFIDAQFGEPGHVNYDARFLDANGDGSTDVIVEQTSIVDGTKTTYRQVHLMPSTLRSTGLSALADADRQVEVFLAPNLDDAATAAMAHVSASFTRKEACATLGASKSRGGLKSISLPDAQVLTFIEPAMATFGATSKRVDALGKGDWSEGPFDCKGYSCDGDAYCVAYDGPGSTHWWLRRVGKQLKVISVAQYGGS